MVEPQSGHPYNWRHFLYGLRVMGVMDARGSLRIASAASVPRMEQSARDEWYRRQERAAEW